jgi:hypothetical protein
MNISLKCDNCKKSFLKDFSLYNLAIKRGYKKQFCSSKCHGIFNNKRIKGACANCGREIVIRRNTYMHNLDKIFFCGHSCSATFNNKKRRKYKSKLLKRCICCNTQTYNKTYCSKTCQLNYLKNKKWEKIEKEGKVNLSDCEEHNRRTAKKYLLETKGHICSICKNTEWLNKPIPLILDHIDGNALNYKTENLRLVCGNCNMMLPTFAGRNRGKGTRSKVPRH